MPVGNENQMIEIELRSNSDYVNANIIISNTNIDLGLLNKDDLKEMASDMVEVIDSISYYINADNFDENITSIKECIKFLK